jgi:tetrahydromethanopterin S-methyltransferase subunit G
MTLTTDDLKQISTIVDKRANQTEKKLEKKIEGEVGSLAAMAKREFDAITTIHTSLVKGQKQIRKDISHLEFIATEMVRRDELIEVKQRLSKIEAKLGILK